MHHWSAIEIFWVLLILGGIAFTLLATFLLWLLPVLQQKGIINFPSLREVMEKGTSQHTVFVALKLALSVMSLALGICFAYALCVEPYQLVVNKLQIRTNKLAKNQFRIVQVSDLHCDDTPRLETLIGKRVAELHPDLIVFCGDAVNSPRGLNTFKSLLKGFAQTAPTYVAKGDWDFSFNPPLDYFGGTGAHELFARPVEIKKKDESIWLAGVPIGSLSNVQETLQKVPAGAFTIFAYHEPYPDVLPLKANVDLFLAGHTHGGQIVLPGIGALITRSKYGTQYVSGIYQLGEMQMYVNSGVGMEGHLPRARFLCPPEIAVFDIVPSDRN